MREYGIDERRDGLLLRFGKLGDDSTVALNTYDEYGTPAPRHIATVTGVVLIGWGVATLLV